MNMCSVGVSIFDVMLDRCGGCQVSAHVVSTVGVQFSVPLFLWYRR